MKTCKDKNLEPQTSSAVETVVMVPDLCENCGKNKPNVCASFDFYMRHVKRFWCNECWEILSTSSKYNLSSIAQSSNSSHGYGIKEP